jgi:hypothetical protein
LWRWRRAGQWLEWLGDGRHSRLKRKGGGRLELAAGEVVEAFVEAHGIDGTLR